MTTNDTHNPDELLPVTEDIEALARDSEENHPFFQRDDLDKCRRQGCHRRAYRDVFTAFSGRNNPYRRVDYPTIAVK